MANRLDIVGPHFKERLALCSAVSCLEEGNEETVRRCMSDITAILGDVSDTLAILSDYEAAVSERRGLIGCSEYSLAGATRLMSDIVAMCSSLSNACDEALPRSRR